jgi:brefeldin A-inhibited guanine nucleotide-exchange protein
MAQKSSKGSGATTTGPIDNADMFLKRGLEKLLSEKDIKKSQYQQLKRACESALGLFHFFDYSSSKFSRLASVTKDTQSNNINETYFLPFELACASNHPRMVDTALDCLQVKKLLK